VRWARSSSLGADGTWCSPTSVEWCRNTLTRFSRLAASY
jgi:hypothetical protein